MGLPWPAASMNYGDINGEAQQELKKVLDEFADTVAARLPPLGLPLHASPLWRPWNLIVIRDAQRILAAFSPLQAGMPAIRWLDRSSIIMPPESLVTSVMNELGMPVTALVILPRPDLSTSPTEIFAAADRHIVEVERANRLGRLGDLTGLSHLEPSLRQFLEDHPDPDRNVFVMMRFINSPQMTEICNAIKNTCSTYGFHAVRADDRDYTGELWSNIEVYMTCCHYAVAVFEDIEKRDFNPNVSLELGYMLGRRKRSLILKEQRLPNLPADVVHRLYKPFDMFAITESVSCEVARWLEVDLGVSRVVPLV
jgi:hypothetical protein